MNITPAPIDPPEVHRRLWHGFEGTVGWDIGANCGQTMGEMTRRFQQVVAFEPAVECFEHLEPWVRKVPGVNVVIVDIAVSDTDGTVTLAALPDKIDTGQLVTPGTHGMEWTPDVPDAVARTVTCRTVDSLVEEFVPPDFMKIDVEGHEGKVLGGAMQVIEDYHPNMLIEFHTPELEGFCHQLLLDAGYDVEIVRHPHYPPRSHMWRQHGWLRAFHPAGGPR